MGLDLERIKENYAKKSDEELLYLAKYDIASKNDEVVEIIKEEIVKRGLDSDLIKIIDNQKKELTEAELNQLVTAVKKTACPICEQSFSPLQAAEIQKIRSILLVTNYSSTPMITCENCISKEKNKQLILNFLLGWWGFPWGLIRTPIALVKHFTKPNNDELLMQAFCIENQGEIILGAKKSNGISDFLKHYHKY